MPFSFVRFVLMVLTHDWHVITATSIYNLPLDYLCLFLSLDLSWWFWHMTDMSFPLPLLLLPSPFPLYLKFNNIVMYTWDILLPMKFVQSQCNLSKPNLLVTSFYVWNRSTVVCFIQLKFTKTSHNGTLCKVLFIQDSGLYRIPVYSGFRFIQDSVYSGFTLFRIPVYSGFRFIQVSSLFRIPVYSGFSLFRVQFRQVSLYLTFLWDYKAMSVLY